MSEICWSGAAGICAAGLLSRCIFYFGFAIFSLNRVAFVVSASQRRCLPVSAVYLVQVARDALLDLLHAPLHLGAREIRPRLFTALNLLPSIAHTGFGEQANHSASFHSTSPESSRPLACDKVAAFIHRPPLLSRRSEGQCRLINCPHTLGRAPPRCEGSRSA